MQGIFIPGITVEMFRNGCLEAIEELMLDGEIYDIEYDPKSAEPETSCSEIPNNWIPCSGCEKRCKKWENLKTSQE